MANCISPPLWLAALDLALQTIVFRTGPLVINS